MLFNTNKNYIKGSGSVKRIATINVNGENKDLYVVLNEKGNTFTYYLDEEIIGAYMPSAMEEKIVFKENSIANELSRTNKRFN